MINVSGATLLGLLFVGLKLGGAVAWPWWLVLTPFWALPALFVAVGLGALVGAGVLSVAAWLATRRP